jgi:hypothetical protein
MNDKKALVVFFLFLSLLLVVFPSVSSSAGALTSSNKDVSEKFYFHLDPNSNYEVGTINTAGAIFNSTTLGFSTSGNTKSGTTSYSQQWYLSQLLAGPISMSGVPSMALDLYASASTTWNYTIQIIEATSDGVTVSVLSKASCSNSCLSLTTTQSLYSFTNFGAISPVTIPSGYVLEVSILIKQTNGTNVVNFVVENSNPSLTSYWTLPLSSNPISLSVPSLTPRDVQSSQRVSYSVNVSDSFGEYDIQNVTAYAYYYPSSSNQFLWSALLLSLPSGTSLSAYSAIWSGALSSVASGSYKINVEAFDNSGNGYTAVPVGFSAETNDSLDYETWIALLATAIIFSALSVIFPVFKPPESQIVRAGNPSSGIFSKELERHDVSQSPTNALIAAGRITMLVRQLVFPIVASIFWFIVASYSAVLSNTFGLAIPYLFFALAYVYLVMVIILGIVIAWGIFWMGKGGRFGI